jgi:hypothetical protein
MNKKIEESAEDLGMEIILGCDKFDYNDFQAMMKKNGIEPESLRQPTIDYINKTFPPMKDGYSPIPDNVNTIIDHWLK